MTFKVHKSKANWFKGDHEQQMYPSCLVDWCLGLGVDINGTSSLMIKIDEDETKTMNWVTIETKE